MTLEAWIRGRTTSLLGPGVWGNVLVVALMLPYASAVLPLGAVPLRTFFLLVAGATLGAELFFNGLVLLRLAVFRDLAAGRVALSAEHRLQALRELRGLPVLIGGFTVLGWLLGAALVGGSLVVFEGLAAGAGWRVASLGVFFGPLAGVTVTLLVAARTQEVADRLAEGLPPGDVIAAAPPASRSVRAPLVAFTALLTVVPAVMVLDVARTALDAAVTRLAALPPEARAVAAEAALSDLTLRLLALGAMSVLFAGVAAASGGRVLAEPMRRLVEAAQHVAQGRLDRASVIAAEGEVWQVTAIFAQLHQRLGELVGKVLGAGAAVEQASQALLETAGRSEQTAAEQAAALNQTSATTEELAQSARQIAGSAAAVQDLARRTTEAAQQGQADAAAFQAAVDRMKQDNRSIAAAVERLQRRVQQIGRIVELINTVADRSDLLALSAELEGTRAGEVGRGFSLVGAEMRRVAENVLESTAEVEELIAEIRDATVRTAEATAAGSALTERGTSLADAVTASLSRVAELAQDTSGEVRTISLATQQQQSSTDQLAEAMGDILSGTQQELGRNQRLAEANQRLLALSGALQEVVGRFRRAAGEADER